MGASGQALPDPLATARAILRREAWGDSRYRDTGYRPVVLQPAQELAPRRVADALCQLMVLDQIGNLEVFIGNQIVRFDQRTCRLGCEVFTLPGNPQIAFGESFESLSCGS